MEDEETRLSVAPAFAPFRYGLADFMGAVFLNEVAAFHGHFALVLPAPTEFALCAGEDGTGISIDEELGQFVLGHPARIIVNDLDDIFRLAIKRDLARP